MIGAPMVTALLLQLAVCSDALLFSQNVRQREDRDAVLYPKEWTLNVTTPEGMNIGSIDEVMGWVLTFNHSWNPVKISEVKPGGLVEEFNKNNPKDAIAEGDELIQVNGCTWKHNSTIFVQRVNQRLRKVLEGGENLQLGVRRPRQCQNGCEDYFDKHVLEAETSEKIEEATQAEESSKAEENKTANNAEGDEEDKAADQLERERDNVELLVQKNNEDNNATELEQEQARLEKELDDAEDDDEDGGSKVDEKGGKHPTTPGDPSARADGNESETEEVEYSKTFQVELKIPSGSKEPLARLMGWKLTSPSGKPVKIGKIRSRGLVADWNAENGEKVEAGDEILKVDNISWSSDSQAFEDTIGKVIEAKVKMEKNATWLFMEVHRSWKEKEKRPKASEAAPPAPASAAAPPAPAGAADPGHKETLQATVESGIKLAQAQGESSFRSRVEGLLDAFSKLTPQDLVELAGVVRRALDRGQDASPP